jgi:hypothetical protein
MKNPQKKVLIIEPSSFLFITWLKKLSPEQITNLEIHLSQTPEKARKRIGEEDIFDLIVIGHSVTDDQGIGTINLIEEIRLNGNGKPILANSLNPEHILEMRIAGATHFCDTGDVPREIAKILGL